jgi:hypothetical protein
MDERYLQESYGVKRSPGHIVTADSSLGGRTVWVEKSRGRFVGGRIVTEPSLAQRVAQTLPSLAQTVATSAQRMKLFAKRRKLSAQWVMFLAHSSLVNACSS